MMRMRWPPSSIPSSNRCAWASVIACDPVVQGVPRARAGLATGAYVRAVLPPEASELSEGTVERLKALGYLS